MGAEDCKDAAMVSAVALCSSSDHCREVSGSTAGGRGLSAPLELQVPEERGQVVGFGVGLVADSLVYQLIPGLAVAARGRGPAHHIHLLLLLLTTLGGKGDRQQRDEYSTTQSALRPESATRFHSFQCVTDRVH